MRDKKKQLIIATVVGFIIIAIGIGFFINKKEISNEEKVAKVIGEKAKIESYIEKDDKVTITLLADLSEEEAKTITKDIFNINKSLNRDFEINFIENGSVVKDDFYYEGLVNRATYSKEAGEIAFESFEKKDVEVAKTIDEFTNNKILNNEDSNLVLAVNMDGKELKDEEIVAQAKAYNDMFKEINKDKTLNSVQVNVILGDKGININDKYSGVYSKVEYMK